MGQATGSATGIRSPQDAIDYAKQTKAPASIAVAGGDPPNPTYSMAVPEGGMNPTIQHPVDNGLAGLGNVFNGMIQRQPQKAGFAQVDILNSPMLPPDNYQYKDYYPRRRF